MTRRTTILIPAILLALILANVAGVAQAGYVSTGLECVRGDSTPVDLSVGAGAASAESAVPTDAIRLNMLHGNRSTLSRAPADFGPSSGMSPPAPEWEGVQPDVLVQKSLPIAGLSMAEWLGAEGRAALPPPLSTGIFRPPRFVG
jgi:hypothetical protein